MTNFLISMVTSLSLMFPQDFIQNGYELCVVLVDGEAIVALMDDAEVIDHVLDIPDYFETDLSDEDYLAMAKYYFAKVSTDHDEWSDLRFIDLKEDGSFLQDENIEDLRSIATMYQNEKGAVKITMTDTSESWGRLSYILQLLKDFGVEEEDTAILLREEVGELTDYIVKLHIERY